MSTTTAAASTPATIEVTVDVTQGDRDADNDRDEDYDDNGDEISQLRGTVRWIDQDRRLMELEDTSWGFGSGPRGSRPGRGRSVL